MDWMTHLFILALEITPQWVGVMVTLVLFGCGQIVLFLKWAGGIQTQVTKAVADLGVVTSEMKNVNQDLKDIRNAIAQYNVRMEGMAHLQNRVNKLELEVTRLATIYEGKHGRFTTSQES